MAPPTQLLRCLLCACILFLTPRSQADDLAPPASYEGKPVSQIRFDPPSQPVLRADLERIFPFKSGTPLHLEDVRTAIKKLYATGLYSNIAFETESAPDGVVLIVRTTEQWFVGPVEVAGKVSNPPNEGQLAATTQLDLGTPFNDDDLNNAEDKMRDLLQRNGLYRATIERQIQRDLEHQLVALTFRVNSGKRARLEQPSITGDTKIPPEKLAKATKYKGWFRWKQATDETVQTGVRNVRNKYGKDDRLTASVTLKDREYDASKNRVKPDIQADGGPKVKIETSGAKVKKSKLQDYVPVFDEQTVNRDLLVSGVRNLRDYFQNRGYFDVQVDYTTKILNPDQEDITYTIAPGARHKVVKVDISGNHYFTTDEIRERMFIQPAGFLRLRHGRYSDGFVKRDQEAVRALYRDNGFRDVKVNLTTVDDYQGKTGDVAVSVTVQEGAQYKVSSLDVQGVNRKDKETMLALLASQAGQPFSETSVAIDRDYILNIYQSTGYPDANFDYRVTPGPGPNEIGVHYTINEGQPRYVRDVLIYGMHSTRMRLVRPNILLHAGEPLSWTEMGRMQRRLYNLGVFDRVDMAIENPDGDTEHKYALFHMVEGHRYYAAFGLGAEVAQIGNATPTGSTGFAPRANLELSRLNFLGLGHSINFKGRYSTLDRRVSLTYLAPRYRNVQGLNISVTGLYDNTNDVATFTARRLEGSFQVSQQLSKPTQILWRYTWRDSRLQNTAINSVLVPLLAQNDRVGMLSASLIQDHRDDPTNARRGFYNTLDFGVADHVLGTSRCVATEPVTPGTVANCSWEPLNFLRFLGRNSYYKAITHDLILASNTSFGVLKPFSAPAGADDFTLIPLAEHFFAGGSTSHRGFPENQAGPRDSYTGFPLGGDALFFHSTELRFPFIGENIDGVLFHDMGNVYSSLSKISFRVHQNNLQDFDYMVHAVGFGIRYRTPVGPVRIDLAYSLNPPSFMGLNGSFQDILKCPTPNTQGCPLTPQKLSVGSFHFFFSIGQAF